MRDKWYYLEYRNPTTDWFVAAQVTKGLSVINAMRRGRNNAPLGEYKVFGIHIPNGELHAVPIVMRNKRLSIEEVRKLWPEALRNERVPTINQATSENTV